eukprot:scaffold1829_cov194-Ochromonas_danica.AAC.25
MTSPLLIFLLLLFVVLENSVSEQRFFFSHHSGSGRGRGRGSHQVGGIASAATAAGSPLTNRLLSDGLPLTVEALQKRLPWQGRLMMKVRKPSPPAALPIAKKSQHQYLHWLLQGFGRVLNHPVVQSLLTHLSSRYSRWIEWCKAHHKAVVFVGKFALGVYFSFLLIKKWVQWYTRVSEYELLLDEKDMEYQSYGGHLDGIISTILHRINDMPSDDQDLTTKLAVALNRPCFPFKMKLYALEISKDLLFVLSELDNRVRLLDHKKAKASGKVTASHASRHISEEYLTTPPAGSPLPSPDTFLNEEASLLTYQAGVTILLARQADIYLRLMRQSLLQAANTCEDLLRHWKERLRFNSQALRIPFLQALFSGFLYDTAMANSFIMRGGSGSYYDGLWERESVGRESSGRTTSSSSPASPSPSSLPVGTTTYLQEEDYRTEEEVERTLSSLHLSGRERIALLEGTRDKIYEMVGRIQEHLYQLDGVMQQLHGRLCAPSALISSSSHEDLSTTSRNATGGGDLSCEVEAGEERLLLEAQQWDSLHEWIEQASRHAQESMRIMAAQQRFPLKPFLPSQTGSFSSFRSGGEAAAAAGAAESTGAGAAGSEREGNDRNSDNSNSRRSQIIATHSMDDSHQNNSTTIKAFYSLPLLTTLCMQTVTNPSLQDDAVNNSSSSLIRPAGSGWKRITIEIVLPHRMRDILQHTVLSALSTATLLQKQRKKVLGISKWEHLFDSRPALQELLVIGKNLSSEVWEHVWLREVEYSQDHYSALWRSKQSALYILNMHPLYPNTASAAAEFSQPSSSSSSSTTTTTTTANTTTTSASPRNVSVDGDTETSPLLESNNNNKMDLALESARLEIYREYHESHFYAMNYTIHQQWSLEEFDQRLLPLTNNNSSSALSNNDTNTSSLASASSNSWWTYLMGGAGGGGGEGRKKSRRRRSGLHIYNLEDYPVGTKITITVDIFLANSVFYHYLVSVVEEDAKKLIEGWQDHAEEILDDLFVQRRMSPNSNVHSYRPDSSNLTTEQQHQSLLFQGGYASCSSSSSAGSFLPTLSSITPLICTSSNARAGGGNADSTESSSPQQLTSGSLANSSAAGGAGGGLGLVKHISRTLSRQSVYSYNSHFILKHYPAAQEQLFTTFEHLSIFKRESKRNIFLATFFRPRFFLRLAFWSAIVVGGLELNKRSNTVLASASTVKKHMFDFFNRRLATPTRRSAAL